MPDHQYVLTVSCPDRPGEHRQVVIVVMVFLNYGLSCFGRRAKRAASLQTDAATGNFYQHASDVVFVDFEA